MMPTVAASDDPVQVSVDPPGVNITADSASYLCSPSCTSKFNVTNFGTINMSMANVTVFNEFSGDASMINFTLEEWNTDTGQWEDAGRWLGGTGFVLENHTFYNTSTTPDYKTYQFRTNISMTGSVGTWGKWNITIQLNSTKSNNMDYGLPKNFTLDPYVDTISLHNPANNADLDTATPTFNYTYTSAQNSTLNATVIVDDTEYVNWTIAGNATAQVVTSNDVLGEGNHTWKVWVDGDDDGAEDADELSGERNLTVDTVAPSLSPFHPNDGDVETGTFTVNATWSDGTTSVVTHKFNVTNASNTARDVGMLNGSVDSTQLADGSYKAGFNATDEANNTNRARVSISIDNDAPQIRTYSPSADTNVSGWVDVEATASDIGSSVTKLDYRWVNTTGDNVTEWRDLLVSNDTIETPTTFPDGKYNLTFKAVDEGGNINKSVNISNVTVDNFAPAVEAFNPSSDRVVSGFLNVTAWSVDTGTTVTSFVYQWVSPDGTYNSGWRSLNDTNLNTSILESLTYNLTFRAEDASGNVNDTVNLSNVTVDNDAPGIIPTEPDADAHVSGNVPIEASFIESDTKVVSAMFNVTNTTGWKDMPSGSLNGSIDSTLLQDGEYTVNYNATDKGNNTGTEALNITIDNTLPFINPKSPADEEIVNFTFDVGAVYNDAIDDSPGAGFNISNSTETPIDDRLLNDSVDSRTLQDGSYNVSYNATDQAGNINASKISISVNNDPPQISTFSPANNSIVGGKNVKVEAFTNSAGAALYRFEYVLYDASGTPVIGDSLNNSFDSTMFPNGEYRIRIEAEDAEGRVNWTNLNIEINNFGVNDLLTPTDTNYPTNVSFIGDDLSILGAKLSHYYNLTSPAPAGDEIDRVSNASQKLSTSSATSGGRYYVGDHNATGQSVTTAIDLVQPFNDVFGRIASPSPITGVTNVTVWNWLNASRVNASTAASYNLSDDISWESGEEAYYLNTTESNYWISAWAEGRGEMVSMARSADKCNAPSVGTPHVNDFQLTQGSNVSGQVVNQSDGQPVQGLQVKLHGFNPTPQSRTPYMTAPPVRQDVTDSNGFYNFTEVEKTPFGYQVQVVNDSIGMNTFNEFAPNAQFNLSNMQPGEAVADLSVTDHAGNVSVKLEGKDSEDVRYAIGMFNQSMNRTFLKLGISPGTINMTDIPNGTYDLMAARFDFTNTTCEPSFNSDIVPDVTVEAAMTTDQKLLGFESLVPVDGYVKDNATDAPIKEARVVLENRTLRKVYYSQTDSTGHYEVNAANNTLYNVKVRPPSGTNYVPNTTTMTVGAGSMSKNITLSTGSALTGQVTYSNGTGIGSVHLRAWNSSKGSYGFNRTNATGHYRIGGLQDINYTLEVFTPKPGLGQERMEVNVSGDTQRDIVLSKDRASISGTVQNSTGHALEANVTVKGLDSKFIRSAATNTTDNGSYAFEKIPEGQPYRVSVVPGQNAQYRDSRRFLYLSGDTSINFTLERIKGVKGYVNASSGPVKGAFVYAYNRSLGSFDSDRTDSEGFYNLDLQDGNHTIDIWPGEGSQYISLSGEVNTSAVGPGDLVNFTLSSGATLQGSVQDPDRASDFSGQIGLWNRSKRAFAWTEFSGGTYSVSGLKNVSYNAWISVDNESYKDLRTEVNRSSLDDSRTFNMSRNKGRSLRITVQDNSTSDVLENASVYLQDREKTTNGNGVVTFSRQPEGANVRVRVSKEDYAARTTSFTIKSRTTSFGGSSETVEYQNETVKLDSVGGKQFDVNVNLTRTGSDKAVSGASVIFLSNESGNAQTSAAVTDSNGRATVEELIDGTYQVTVAVGEDEFNTTTTKLDTGANKHAILNETLDPDLKLWYGVEE